MQNALPNGHMSISLFWPVNANQSVVLLGQTIEVKKMPKYY